MAAVMEEKNLGMREFISAIFLFSSLFYLVILLTFNIEDPGWTHSGIASAPKNLGGIIGAWLSDLTFSLFGFQAYLFPVIIGWHGYLFYKQEHRSENALDIILHWIGLLITLIAGSVMFYLHVPRLMIELPNGSGGILGQEAGDTLLLMLSETNTTVLSSSIFLLGFSFFIGFSWLNLIDRIGQSTVWLLTAVWRLAVSGQRIAPPASGKKKIPNLR
jgi:DNA segregation ATPase FtsK/SpoIIIE, S-DNA-T family